MVKMSATRDVLRIGNCSGYYGDRFAAAREMVEGGPLDVLTGDYLAELTMLILWKARQRDPAGGYATTFLAQMEQVLGTCLDRNIKIVTNAAWAQSRRARDRARTPGRATRAPSQHRPHRRRRPPRPHSGASTARSSPGAPRLREEPRRGRRRARDRQRLPGRLGDHRGAALRRRHRGVPPGDRRRAGGRTGGLGVRLAAGRLGPAGRRRRRRAHHRMRPPGHRRQLLLLLRAARQRTAGLPDRRDGGGRLVRDHQARRRPAAR